MTDKEIEEKKKEFLKEFVKPDYYNDEWWLDNNSVQDVWQWIEELVEEVEKKTEEDLIGEYGTFGMRPED